MNKNQRVNLRMFATIDDILTSNAEAFGEGDTTKQSYEALTTKLKDLGYDVLINHREKAEFIPSARLSDVVSQREAFKSQAEAAIKELNQLKTQAGMTPEAQQKLNELITQNETLLDELQKTSVQLEIMSNATDAINPKDIIPFINMDAIKLDKNGKILSGVTEEVTRLRTEKPYLFAGSKPAGSKGGFDGSGAAGAGGAGKPDMNAAIRRAAFGGSRSF